MSLFTPLAGLTGGTFIGKCVDVHARQTNGRQPFDVRLTEFPRTF